jgi:hypothetical protein
MRRIVSSLLCIAAGAAGAPLCPQIAPTTVPAWVDVLSNHFNALGSPGTYFLFSNLEREPRKPGQSLPITVRTHQSAVGAYDGHTFPAGGPIYYSNSSGASIECLPGLDPSVSETLPTRPRQTLAGCPVGQVGEKCGPDGDCTGKRILRTPSIGIQSALTNGITGIQYFGTFDGFSEGGPEGLVEVVFFHQSADYLGQAEYGFLRDMSVPNQLTFYWQTNANCTLHSITEGDTMCTTLEGNRQPGTYVYTDGIVPGTNSPITGGCNIDLGPAGGFGLYDYSMWIYPDAGTLKFGISIVDPSTSLPVVPAASIDPNVGAPSTWFPVAELNGGSGYITAGISRYDPFRTQTVSVPTAPSMSIQRIAIPTTPQ